MIDITVYAILEGSYNASSDKLSLGVMDVYLYLESAKSDFSNEINWYRLAYQNENLEELESSEICWHGLINKTEHIVYKIHTISINSDDLFKIDNKYPTVTRLEVDRHLDKTSYPYIVVGLWCVERETATPIEHYLYFYCHTIDAAKGAYIKYFKETAYLDLDPASIPDSRYFDQDYVYKADERNKYFCYIDNNE